MKQIPYGIDNFDRIINDDYYYIDKSQYIKTVEDQASYILFVRPRRMGKSLFVNMLMSYYDINKKDQFAQLFGSLWIGANPTPYANKYLVLKFDFSKVAYSADKLEENFSDHCFTWIEDFLFRYNRYFTEQEQAMVKGKANAKAALVALLMLTERKNLPTYLFIDEYDNFSNTVLAARGVKAHDAITHGEGFYRDFFKVCKGTFHRIFMTGVTPVTYDDLTSGFNIADVVALAPQFDKIMGVTETELGQLIEYYRREGAIKRPTHEIIAEMKPWYDNYCFCEDCYGVEPPIYNTDMVMRYIKSMVVTGNAPKEMLDTNARTDYNKLNYLVLAEDLENRNARMDLVKDVCAKGYTHGKVREQFPAASCGDEENFKSMLYYFGTLTFGGHDKYGTRLIVPNKTMGELYLQYMLMLAQYQGYEVEHDYKNLINAIREAATDGLWTPMIEQVGECYSHYSSIRNAIRGEADVQGFIRGLLCLNDYFEVWPELELGNGYCDVLLVPKNSPHCFTRYSYLLEIKYMKADDTNVGTAIAKACEQLDRYVADKHLADSALLQGTPLTKLYLVFQGQQLLAYGQHN